MGVKEEVYAVLDTCVDNTRREALNKIMPKFKIKAKTAEAYYTAWKKAYLVPKVTEKEVLENAIKEKQLPRVREERKVMSNEENDFGGFTPITLKGKQGVYGFSSEGVRIDSVTGTFITGQIIVEQQKALDIWKKYYNRGNSNVYADPKQKDNF